VRGLWRLVAAHRDYRLLLGAGLVSLVGDWLLGVGLSFLVYDLTGSTVASGLLLVATYLPQVALGSLGGVLVDRWNRRRTMIVTNVLQALVLLPLLLADSPDRVWIVYVVGFGQGALQQLFIPAEQATVPHLVPADELLRANAVNTQTRNVARLVGSAAGGLVAAWGGLQGIALVDLATFLGSALLIAAIQARPAPPPREARTEVSSAVGRLRREWTDGLAVIAASPALRVLLTFGVLTAVGEGIMGTLFAPFVLDVIGGSGADYGFINGVQSVGGVLGGLVVATLGARWLPRPVLGWGAVVFGFIDLCLFLYPLLWPHVLPALVFMVLVGLPSACVVSGFMTLFQTATEDAYRGRVFGAILAVESLSILVGAGLASWLGEAIGIVPVIAVQGAGYVVGGVLVLVALRLPEHDEHTAPATAG
jgi:MFS family permease